MMYRDAEKDVTARLLAFIGEPYEHPDGCMKFLKRALHELGVEIDGRAGLADGRLFVKVAYGDLGTVIVWKGLDRSATPPRFHVGLMLDRRWALQCSVGTNGVARIETTRSPWVSCFKGFYRPKKLCS
jgi:hypothetical protein